MIYRSLILAIAVFLLCISPVWAAVLCYDDKYYPSVARLEQTQTGFIAHLGGRYLSTDNNVSSPHFNWPTLVYTKTGRWEKGGTVSCTDQECLGRKDQSKIDIPPVTLSYGEAVVLRPELKDYKYEIEQKISAWTERTGMIWFGIEFYSGEGTSGVGGIGRYNPKTKKMEVRRPMLIRDSSIRPVLYDGEYLWFGTFGAYECIGSTPIHGLVRYEWDTDRIETIKGKEDGPCGFIINDLLLQGDHLWVATDLGLSKLNRKSLRWDHYLPDPETSPPMHKTTCAKLYNTLLDTLPKEQDTNLDFEGSYIQLFNSLAHFRPDFLRGYVKKKPSLDWACHDLRFLGKDAKDFNTLKKEVISFRPVGSPHFECLLDGFGKNGNREPEWRDLLLSIVGLPRNENFRLRVNALSILKSFPGDKKVGEMVVNLLRDVQPGKRLKRDEELVFELLPITLGRKSVPILMEALVRFRDDKAIENIGEALEKATNYYWHPESKSIEPLPDNRPEHYYKISFKDAFISQWKSWWEIHKSEYQDLSGQP